jgi:lipopolysaccharide export system protein LptA
MTVVAMVLAVAAGLADPAQPSGASAAAAPPVRGARPSAGAPAARRPAPAPVHIDADEVQYQYKERRVVFVGKPLVRLTRGDAVLSCRKLVADNDADGRIQRATCSGDVKLVQQDRTVTCETAIFESAAGKVVCQGKPVVRDGPSVMEGEELTYLLDEERLVMTRPKGTMHPAQGADPVAGRRKVTP